MTRENKHQAFRVGSSLRLWLRFMALNLHFLPISTSETKENLNPPRSRQPPKEKRSAAVGSKSEQNIIFISHFHLASRIALSLSLSPSLALLLLAALHILLYQPGGTWSRPNGASQGERLVEETVFIFMQECVRVFLLRCGWSAVIEPNDLGSKLVCVCQNEWLRQRTWPSAI